MSQSRLLPAWRPIGKCDHKCAWPDGCNQDPAFDRDDGLCGYHAKLTGERPLIAQNGAESRSTPPARSTFRTRAGRPTSRERAATLKGGIPRSGTQCKYPYDSWFNGETHVLVAGQDFGTVNVEDLRTRITRTARSRGYDATVSKLGDTITITPKQGAVA